MRLKQEPRRGRAGFTLVELLIVIAILAILFAMTTVAVGKFLIKGAEVSTRSDISQLSTAIETFKSKFNVEYLPSRIALYEDRAAFNTAAGTDPLAAASLRFLKKMFHEDLGIVRDANGNPTAVPLDWNGNGQADTNPHLLEGHQCLVFFLGGIPELDANGNPIGVTGFSTNKRVPTQAGGERMGPFFEFKASRLLSVTGVNAPSFPSYVDGYGKMPYAYFSSYGRRNGYNPYTATTPPYGSDNTGLTPYQRTANNFWNPTSFQIISAGEDGQFGTVTGVLTPGESVTAPVADNMTNVYESLLGSGS